MYVWTAIICLRASSCYGICVDLFLFFNNNWSLIQQFLCALPQVALSPRGSLQVIVMQTVQHQEINAPRFLNISKHAAYEWRHIFAIHRATVGNKSEKQYRGARCALQKFTIVSITAICSISTFRFAFSAIRKQKFLPQFYPRILWGVGLLRHNEFFLWVKQTKFWNGIWCLPTPGSGWHCENKDFIVFSGNKVKVGWIFIWRLISRHRELQCEVFLVPVCLVSVMLCVRHYIIGR